MYHLTINPEKRLIRIAVSGYSDAAEFDRMIAEAQAAVRTLKASGNSFDMLSDVRDGHVIPTESASQSEQFMKWLAQNGIRKSALVVASAILKMQLDRMSADPRFGFFATEEAALEWLAS